MRPQKVTVVRYMIIYIYIYIYTDSAGVDRTRRGSLRLAPISIASRSTLRYTYLGDMAVASSPAGPVLTGPVFCEVVPNRACAEL